MITILTQNIGRIMRLKFILDLVLNIGTWNASHPLTVAEAAGDEETEKPSDLLKAAIAAEKREKPRESLTVNGVKKSVAVWCAIIDAIVLNLPDGVIVVGGRHRLLAALLLAGSKNIQELDVPYALTGETARIASVRENMAQLLTMKAGNAEIWNSVFTLRDDCLARYEQETIGKVSRNQFGEFFSLPNGKKQKFKYMLETFYSADDGANTDEVKAVIETGLDLDHKAWASVRDAVAGCPVGDEVVAAQTAIDKVKAEKAAKDKPLTAVQIAKLVGKAAKFPHVADLLTAVQTGDYDGAIIAIREMTEAAKAE